MSAVVIPPPNLQQLFNARFWPWRPTPVQAAANWKLTPAERTALWDSLIAHGYGAVLISAIDSAWAEDPYTVILQWVRAGQTWTSNAFMPPIGSPNGYAEPGDSVQPGQLGPYPKIPPAGGIPLPPMLQLFEPGADVNALLAKWFPPYNPPPPAPNAPTDPVGAVSAPGSRIYGNAPGVDESHYPNGSQWSDDRGTFVHIVTNVPFGVMSYWLLVKPTS